MEPIQNLSNEVYKPSAKELISRHEVRIQPLSIGCVVYVGCKSIPFLSISDAMKELEFYYSNPHAAYEKWSKELEVNVW